MVPKSKGLGVIYCEVRRVALCTRCRQESMKVLAETHTCRFPARYLNGTRARLCRGAPVSTSLHPPTGFDICPTKTTYLIKRRGEKGEE